MTTIYYILALFCVLAALVLAIREKWNIATFFLALAIWLNAP